MDDPHDAALTPQQRKWFASLRAGLERDTGRSLEAWIALARTCPETRPRARLRWFKETHGLLQNRAAYVLSVAFPPETPGWSEPDALRAALWSDPRRLAILEALEGAVAGLEGLVQGQRKGYTAFSRKAQFAAARPARAGVLLGLALPPERDARLEPSRGDGWSERLTARLTLRDPAAVAAARPLILEAHARS